MAHRRDELPHEETLHETHIGCGEYCSEKAKDVLHDVAEKTMELAHEVKEKISGHVTEKELAHAGSKIAKLKEKLACERQQIKDILSAVEVAENVLNLTEYEELKEREQKMKALEKETEKEIEEAEYDYHRLQIALRTQQHAHMTHKPSCTTQFWK